MNARFLAVIVSILAACGGATPELGPPPPAPTLPPAPGSAAGPTTVAPPGSPPTTTPAASGAAQLTSKPLALPGATGPASLDYIAYERGRSRVWVPVPSTGSVDVLDVATGTFTRIDGFKTEVRENNGRKRTMGPSAATVGEGFVYIGNRATSEVCPVDVATLKPAKCTKIAASSDGVAYVAASKEVWVTSPKEQSLSILDATTPGALKTKTTVKVDGAPEGYAVDEAHALFFTNLEDKGPTLAIDVKTHKVKSTWNAGCGSDGPRGLAFDAPHGFLVVACTDHVQVLDAGHDGALLGKLDTGAGVDNLDFADGKLFVAAGKAQKVMVATLDAKGQFTVVATGDTSEGARNPVADSNGNVYVADSQAARILMFAAAK